MSDSISSRQCIYCRRIHPLGFCGWGLSKGIKPTDVRLRGSLHSKKKNESYSDIFDYSFLEIK